MQFATIPEQYILKNTLLQAAKGGKVAHAQVFIGNVGSAHLAMALAFATYLNCTSSTENDSCATCFSCRGMAKLTHPDVQLVFPRQTSSIASEKHGATKEINQFRNCLKSNPFLTIEEWIEIMGYNGAQCQITRQDANYIIQRVSLKAFMGPYKIVLIWLPECLTYTAANALLKTLEEPPSNTIFLLISCNKEKILPTIRSRSQHHFVSPFSQAALEQMLRTTYTDLPDQLYREIAFVAEGNLSKAFLLAKGAEIDNFHHLTDLMRNCYRADFTNIVQQSESFHVLSAKAQQLFFAYALQLLRVVLLRKVGYLPHTLQTVLQQEDTFSKKFGLTVTLLQLKKIIILLNKAYHYLERNASAKMVYIHTSIEIVKIFKG